MVVHRYLYVSAGVMFVLVSVGTRGTGGVSFAVSRPFELSSSNIVEFFFPFFFSYST